MEFLLIIFAIALGVLFFLNIKSSALILCKSLGGFIFLLIYNSIAPRIGMPLLGANLLSASICGMLGIPGGLLLLCLNL